MDAGERFVQLEHRLEHNGQMPAFLSEREVAHEAVVLVAMGAECAAKRTLRMPIASLGSLPNTTHFCCSTSFEQRVECLDARSRILAIERGDKIVSNLWFVEDAGPRGQEFPSSGKLPVAALGE